MTRSEMNDLYFKWLCDFVSKKGTHERKTYTRLLAHLHRTPFDYSMPMDGNRAEDGENLRYRFGRSLDISSSTIAYYLDDRPCSVLEMMIALADRCEVHIMYDPDNGNQTSKWFWSMIDNLGLTDMYNANYNEDHVTEVLDRLLDRTYAIDGSGGLFTVKHRGRDMRKVEIWYQMMWYLDELIQGGTYAN